MFRKKITVKSSEVKGDVVAGDKYGLDEDMMKTFMEDMLSKITSPNQPKLGDEDCKKVAGDLLKSFGPRSLLTLYQNVSEETAAAISSIDWQNRRLVNAGPKLNESNRSLTNITELLSFPNKKHLIIGPGGLGKTHTLWHTANQLLEFGQGLPIYLSLADFNSVSEVITFVDDLFPHDGGFTQLKQHPNVIFFLDGWSQFPKGFTNVPERQKLLAMLGDSRVIATGRYMTPYDTPFSIWELEGLSDRVVKTALSIGVTNVNAHDTEKINELLRLPLMLIIYLLLQGGSLSKGELLSEFQRNLTPGDPHQSSQLLSVMSKAMARVHLLHKSNRKSDFDREVSSLVATMDAKELPNQIDQLATLGNQPNQLKPIHDLYQDWLLGMGIIQEWETLSFLSVQDLSTREGIQLALESGELFDSSHLESVMNLDLLFAASFLRFVTAKNAEENRIIKTIIKRIEDLMASDQDCDRYRGILAALSSHRPTLLKMGLNTLSELVDQGYYFHDLEPYIDPTFLSHNRSLIADWLKDGKGSDYFLSVIRKSGDGSWLSWVKEQYEEGKLSPGQAIGTALACVSTLPSWVEQDLAALIQKRQSYELRAAAKRGENRELAKWVMKHYASLVQPGNSTFYDLNLVLVGCGEESLFDQMYEQFDSYPPLVQELLLYAFKDRDDSWMIKFQEKYLCTGNIHIYHLLFDNVYVAISDEKAEEWTQHPNERVQAHGWKTLVKKHQNEMVSRLIEHLPKSFDAISYVPTLKAMQELNDPPASIVEELWKRLHGQIKPMLMEDMLYALAKVYPVGLASIIGHLKDHPDFLPDYHLYRFLQLLKDWSKRGGIELRVKAAQEDIEFPEYLLLNRLSKPDSDYFLANSIKVVNSKCVFDYLMLRIEAGDKGLYKVLLQSGGPASYHSALATYVLGLPAEQSLKDLFQLFGNRWHTFPESQLIDILDKINESKNKQSDLFTFINQISKHPQEPYDRYYKRLIVSLFEFPESYVHPYRDLASLLSHYPTDYLTELLDPFLLENRNQTLWLIRLIEMILERKLIDEEAQWL
ncbi:hypothetical protein ACQKF0_25535 [Bacillus wiedmannii]|uniref:hypothetical protein n=1 Tax=Bacillus wiedmannii TaxID=1890302 RepID=UPI003CEB4FF9